MNKKQPPVVFYKKGVLKNFAKFSVKHLCWSLFFNKVAGLVYNFIKKETSTLVFSCEYTEKTRFYKTPLGSYFWLNGSSDV